MTQVSLNHSGLKQTFIISQIHLVLVAQSHPTLRCPVNCSLPGSSVHGISQARVLEWVATSLSITKMMQGNLSRGGLKETFIISQVLWVRKPGSVQPSPLT